MSYACALRNGALEEYMHGRCDFRRGTIERKCSTTFTCSGVSLNSHNEVSFGIDMVNTSAGTTRCVSELFAYDALIQMVPLRYDKHFPQVVQVIRHNQ